MSICEALCKFLKRQKTNSNKDSDPPESHSGSSSQSRILDIERAESAKRAAQIQHTERLCATQKAQTDAVLERLGFIVPDDTQPSPHQTLSKKSPESSLRGKKITPISKEGKKGRKSRTKQTLQEEEPFFEKKLHLGSRMAILACKLAKFTEAGRSSSPDSSLSSVDMQTPSELRSIVHFPSSLPPTAATRRPSRLPVLILKPGQAKKNVADGCRLQTAQSKLENFVENLKKFNPLHPPPPAAPRRAQAMTGRVRTPPSRPNRRQCCTPDVKPKVAAASVRSNKRKPYRGAPVVKPKVQAPSGLPNKTGLHIGPKPCATKADAGQEDLQALVNPAESLSLCLKRLSSDEWEKNLDGLKSVQALARNHPALLQTKLHEVCLILIKGVNNLRSAVACSALDCIGELHVHLGRAMDTKAEWTGRALLLKLAKTTNVFVHQRANLALDALVEGCCPGRVMSVLFNTGLRHTSVAVRESTAQHLRKLVGVVGEDLILTLGKLFIERFLTAVSKMAVDAAPKVRHHGRMMIKGLAQQQQLIPKKYLPPLQKIFR
ncbi:uncharacterized protein [Clinocottus analis]|uniref:uncharacterized protein n=1 Tax=Clinocottus analis TaxID=304258 RepID=UPI0035BF69D1